MKTISMPSCAVALVLLSAWQAQATALGHARSFLSGGLQPEVAAQTLVRVQDEWIAQAATFADCRTKFGISGSCSGSQQSFGKSCTKVVDGIVKGSSGDQNMAREYMNLVCSQKSLQAVHREHCLGLKQAIDGALQFNEYANRQRFNSGELCTKFWSTFADAEQKRAEAERAAEKEMLIKANERAKVLAEKRKQEEAHQKAVEAQRQAVEAKMQAARARKEAAEHLARKKAEAQAMAVAAQRKVAEAAFEAAKAAEEHKQRQLEHEKAEEHLRTLTMAHQKMNAANTSAHSEPTSVSAPVVKLSVSKEKTAKNTDKVADKIVKSVIASNVKDQGSTEVVAEKKDVKASEEKKVAEKKEVKKASQDDKKTDAKTSDKKK